MRLLKRILSIWWVCDSVLLPRCEACAPIMDRWNRYLLVTQFYHNPLTPPPPLEPNMCMFDEWKGMRIHSASFNYWDHPTFFNVLFLKIEKWRNSDWSAFGQFHVYHCIFCLPLFNYVSIYLYEILFLTCEDSSNSHEDWLEDLSFWELTSFSFPFHGFYI